MCRIGHTVILIWVSLCWYNHHIMLVDIQLDDIVVLKKPHPCGSLQWKVTRVGADIRLECCQCSRRILLTRREFQRRLKKVLESGNKNEYEN